MKKILLAALLIFAMFTNLNASENNCTVEKCKTEKSTDKNCTVEKCKAEKANTCCSCCVDINCTDCKSDKSVNGCCSCCTDKDCKKCETAVKKASCKGAKKADTDIKSPTWSASTATNSAIKAPACCKGKKKEEAKEEKPAMKCAAGKCGGGK